MQNYKYKPKHSDNIEAVQITKESVANKDGWPGWAKKIWGLSFDKKLALYATDDPDYFVLTFLGGPRTFVIHNSSKTYLVRRSNGDFDFIAGEEFESKYVLDPTPVVEETYRGFIIERQGANFYGYVENTFPKKYVSTDGNLVQEGDSHFFYCVGDVRDMITAHYNLENYHD